jgi:hypothetical protein
MHQARRARDGHSRSAFAWLAGAAAVFRNYYDDDTATISCTRYKQPHTDTAGNKRGVADSA